MTLPGDPILGQDAEGAHTGHEPAKRYLVLHQGGWQPTLMAPLKRRRKHSSVLM
jgi:hypothetical protein